ncbi:MAG: Flp pilus assembly complex ATPase component TadA [Erysipelotrichia bacterium]|nr:Flp pilus assembly complex ATPase component TadA [Erysipelotrichia bacterium]
MPQTISLLLEVLIANQLSIVIGGQTGVGKTELQKYLLSLIPPNSRVVVIDNVQELTYNSANAKIDLNCWQVNSHIYQASFQELIRNALRSNPDWLVIAESRGKEMLDVLNAVMTGHPVITTIHAQSAETIPNRMVRMILMNGHETIYSEALNDINEHFRYFVFLEKNVSSSGKISRYLSIILEYDSETGHLNPIYQKVGQKDKYGKPSTFLLSLINQSSKAIEIAKGFTI